MNRNLFKHLGFLTLFLFAFQWATAQKSFDLQPNPNLVVSGTSTLHDWDMPSNTAQGSMQATEESGSLTAINSLKIEMPAESIKSGKKAMDKKAYDALKTSKNKSVVFNLKSATKTGNAWVFKGSFSIAGVTKDVTLDIVEASSSGEYGFSGSYEFKLSDYDITPPTAVMGTIKTGDEVKVSFDVKFK